MVFRTMNKFRRQSPEVYVESLRSGYYPSQALRSASYQQILWNPYFLFLKNHATRFSLVRQCAYSMRPLLRHSSVPPASHRSVELTYKDTDFIRFHAQLFTDRRVRISHSVPMQKILIILGREGVKKKRNSREELPISVLVLHI